MAHLGEPIGENAQVHAEQAAVSEAEPPADAQVTIEYYTDPLCSWSWAFEPQWRRLRYEFGGQIAWRYRMGGMIPDWHSYADPFNSVSQPSQMGPQWYEVQRITGMPLDASIWLEHPPHSSYPACVAVKAAEAQGVDVAERLLRRLREAVMLERANIAEREVLTALAEQVAGQNTLSSERTALDLARFHQALDDGSAIERFRDDLKEARYQGFGRFPTLVLRRVSGRALLIVGYRPYDLLRDAFNHLAPDLAPTHPQIALPSYMARWPNVTAAEAACALACTIEEATVTLQQAVHEGTVGVTESGMYTRAVSLSSFV